MRNMATTVRGVFTACLLLAAAMVYAAMQAAALPLA